MNLLLLSLALVAGWDDCMRLKSPALATAPFVEVIRVPVARPAPVGPPPACPGCVCGCTEGKPCGCAGMPVPTTPLKAAPPAAKPVATATDVPRTAVHTAFIGGRWQPVRGLLQPSGMVSYDPADNPGLILTPPPQPAPQVYYTAAPPVSSCSGGSCRRR